MSQEEIWKDIPGYEGLYQASTLGRIKSLKHYGKEFINHGTPCRKLVPERILKGSYDEDGYLDVDIYDGVNKRPKTCRMHRLVALTFLPNPNDYEQIDHLNGVKDDNRVCNLEWVTCKENINRAWRDGRCTGPTITPQHRERIGKIGKRMVQWRGRPCRCIEDNRAFISIASASEFYSVSSNVLWSRLKDNRPCYVPNRGADLHFEYISKDSEEYKVLLKEFHQKLEKEENP